MKTKEMCAECGKTFLAGPNAFLCEACIKKRLSEGARKRKLSEMGRKAQKEMKNAT
jgi:hypothetical protein